MVKELIYLDHAAATPMGDDVLEAMKPYFKDIFFNPSSPYAPAVEVRREYAAAKQRIAECFGAKGDDIIITAGATESINLMFAGVEGHVVTSSIEHSAVLSAAARHEYSLATPDEKGNITPEAVAKVLRPDTVLVSIGLANNEIGTVQLLKDISTVIEAERQRRFEAGEKPPLYFHTDASQGVGLIDIHVSRLGVDAMTINSGKVYGPKQVGLLWLNNKVRLTPQIIGGGQEHGMRSGTENVAGVFGFAQAIEHSTRSQKSESERLSNLRDSLQKKLAEAFPEAIFSGNQKKRLPNYLHVSFPGIDAERIVFLLENEGVMVATGSACAANKHSRSHVLVEIGLAPEVADGSLRITLGRLNDEENIDKAAEIITRIVEEEKVRSKK